MIIGDSPNDAIEQEAAVTTPTNDKMTSASATETAGTGTLPGTAKPTGLRFKACFSFISFSRCSDIAQIKNPLTSRPEYTPETPPDPVGMLSSVMQDSSCCNLTGIESNKQPDTPAPSSGILSSSSQHPELPPSTLVAPTNKKSGKYKPSNSNTRRYTVLMHPTLDCLTIQ